MAVTITVAQLAAAIRVGDTTEETAEVTRLLAYATEAVERHLGSAFDGTPDVVVNEAIIRIAGYIFDSPTASRGGFAIIIRNSGAAAILLPYRQHRAGSTGTGPAAEATPAIPATGGLDRDQVQALIALALEGYTPEDATARRDAMAAAAAAEANARAIAALPAPTPAYQLPTATAATRGGVTAATDAIVDDETAGVFGWAIAQLKRLVNAIVPAWARDASTAIPVNKLKLANTLHVSASAVQHTDQNPNINLRDVPAPERGRRYAFFAEAANAGAVGIAIGALTQPLRHLDGSALEAGEIEAGEFVEIVATGDAATDPMLLIGGHPARSAPATESAPGTVTLARAEDVADSETDLSRVPTVTRAIALIRRLIGENVRSVPEVAEAHIGRPLVAVRAGEAPGWRELTGDGLANNSIPEGKLDAAARTKLNARSAGAVDTMAREAVMAEADTRAAADAALGARIDGKQATLTVAQRLGFLQFDTVPATVIGYTAADMPIDWRIWVSGGDTVGDVWMEALLEGQAMFAASQSPPPGTARTRHKLAAGNIYNYTLQTAQRDNLVSGRTARRQGRDIEVDLRFYDAATGGNLIDVVTIAVDWLPKPSATAPSPRWYVLGQARIARNNVAGTAIALALQTREDMRDFAIDAKYADYAAVKAAVDSGEITQVAVRLIEVDGDGQDSDEETHVKPLNSWFSEATSIKVFDAFEIGQDPKKITLAFGARGVTVTPDFSFQGDGGQQAGLTVRLGIWA